MYPEVDPVRAPFFAPLAFRRGEVAADGAYLLLPHLLLLAKLTLKQPAGLRAAAHPSLLGDGHVVEAGHASSQLCRIGKRTGLVEGDGPGGGFGGKVAFQTGTALGSKV